MSLFVGNISRNVDQKTVETAFTSFGPCKFEFRDKDGEAAKNDLHNKDFGGLKLNVEWSKKSGRFDENDQKAARRESHSKSENRGATGGRRSPSWGRKRRSSPRYRRSVSVSVNSDDCPRDRELKKRLQEQKEQKKNKKEKKDSKERKDKDGKEKDVKEKEVKENKESRETKDRERDGKEKKEKKEKKHKDRSRERKKSKSPRRRDREDSYRQDSNMDIPMPN